MPTHSGGRRVTSSEGGDGRDAHSDDGHDGSWILGDDGYWRNIQVPARGRVVSMEDQRMLFPMQQTSIPILISAGKVV